MMIRNVAQDAELYTVGSHPTYYCRLTRHAQASVEWGPMISTFNILPTHNISDDKMQRENHYILHIDKDGLSENLLLDIANGLVKPKGTDFTRTIR